MRVVEIEPQTLWTRGTAPGALPRGSAMELRELTTLPQQILTHGIGYPIGGTICDQQQHIDEFRHWTQQLNAPWTSEHLSILHVETADGPQPCGFLMPPAQTDAQVTLAAENIRQRKAKIGRPFAFETGVNYFKPQPGEIPDGEFFAAIAEASNCGILLDLNNLWVNAKNGRAAISDVLARLPLDRVWEVHLAGATFAHGHWLDAHSGGIDPDLTMIAADIIPDLPNLGAIIFEIAPDRVTRFGAAAFLREMETLHRLWETASQSVAAPAPVRSFAIGGTGPSPPEWEHWIAGRMLPGHSRTVPAGPDAANERSISLYSELAKEFRFGAISDLLRHSIRLLLLALGEASVRELLDAYTASVPAAAYPSDEALRFRRFLATRDLPVPGFSDTLAFEAASIEAAVDSRTVQVALSCDIDTLLADIAAGRIPAACDAQAVTLEIGVDPQPFVRPVEANGSAA